MAQKRTALGIDPGSQCGWALMHEGPKLWASGTWHLRTSGEAEGMGGLRLQARLERVFEMQRPDLVAYEKVVKHGKFDGTRAAHIYGGLVMVLTTVCENYQIPYSSFPVGTIKRFATGKGNASKDMMVQYANKRFNGDFGEDEADAIYIAALALWHLRNGK